MSEIINNRRHRIETLKEIIKELHSGAAPSTVKDRLSQLVDEVGGSEIAMMEQELMAEGMPVEEVRSMCDLHAEVLRDAMERRVVTDVPPGHPVDTFRRENRAIERVLHSIRQGIDRLTVADGEGGASETTAPLVEALRADLAKLERLDVHYTRKEHLLFAYLEKHGIEGPSKVMWAKDDEVREKIRALSEAVARLNPASLESWASVRDMLVLPTIEATEQMIYKEERILFPMALDTLTDEEWGEIHDESTHIGFCLVEPAGEYDAPPARQPEYSAKLPPDGAVLFPSGTLNQEQLTAMFNLLPLDTTFVDAEDRVVFFSEGAHRIFARGRSVLGRKVQNCHPPGSVHVVQKILDDFRSKRQDNARFWIQMGPRFIYICFFAVRNQHDDYLGTLETMQDLTELRALTGERRLLEYDR